MTQKKFDDTKEFGKQMWETCISSRSFLPVVEIVTGRKFSSTQDALLTLFPETSGKDIIDVVPELVEQKQYQFKEFPTTEIKLPFDWSMNPFHNRSWIMNLQNLSFIDYLYKPDGNGVNEVALIVHDWVRNVLFLKKPLEFTWMDGSTQRLDRVGRFIKVYFDTQKQLHLPVLNSLADLVISHLFFIMTDKYYYANHNHGFMADLALLGNLNFLDSIMDTKPLYHYVEMRLRNSQFAKTVTSEGVHTENSPHYHIVFMDLLTSTIQFYLRGEKVPPQYFLDLRNRMLKVLQFFIQPTFTFPQFGDTEGLDRRRQISKLLKRISSEKPLNCESLVEISLIKELWCLLKGTTLSSQPQDSLEVYYKGGYAVLRSQENTMGISNYVGHFKCTGLNRTHSHRDDTSFEICALGQKVVVDSGFYDYRSNPKAISKHSFDARAHNLLIVNNEPFGPSAVSQKYFGKPDSSRVIAAKKEENIAWVQGTHSHYQHLDVWLVRTFGFIEPHFFFVIDSIYGPTNIDYDQYLHFHPDFHVEKEMVSASCFMTDKCKTMEVLITPLDKGSIEITWDRGLEKEDEIRGWYFSEPRTQIPNTQLRLKRKAKSNPQNRIFKTKERQDFGCLISIRKRSNEDPNYPQQTFLKSNASHIQFGWIDNKNHSYEVDNALHKKKVVQKMTTGIRG